MGQRPEEDTNEFLQARIERQIREQCDLHGWAAAVTVANPVDVLIYLEEQCEEDNIDLKIHISTTLKGKINVKSK